MCHKYQPFRDAHKVNDKHAHINSLNYKFKITEKK